MLAGCPADRRPEEPPGDRTRVLTNGTPLPDVRHDAKRTARRSRRPDQTSGSGSGQCVVHLLDASGSRVPDPASTDGLAGRWEHDAIDARTTGVRPMLSSLTGCWTLHQWPRRPHEVRAAPCACDCFAEGASGADWQRRAASVARARRAFLSATAACCALRRHTRWSRIAAFACCRRNRAASASGRVKAARLPWVAISRIPLTTNTNPIRHVPDVSACSCHEHRYVNAPGSSPGA